jgi:hypothetical protein
MRMRRRRGRGLWGQAMRWDRLKMMMRVMMVDGVDGVDGGGEEGRWIAGTDGVTGHNPTQQMLSTFSLASKASASGLFLTCDGVPKKQFF